MAHIFRYSYLTLCNRKKRWVNKRKKTGMREYKKERKKKGKQKYET